MPDLYPQIIYACDDDQIASPQAPQICYAYAVINQGRAWCRPDGPHIAPPDGPVVLSLTGNIGATNGPGRLDFDMATLEKLGLIEFTVDDPYLKRATTDHRFGSCICGSSPARGRA